MPAPWGQSSASGSCGRRVQPRSPPTPPPSLSCSPLLRSGHQHLPWRLPDDVLAPRVPHGPLQDPRRSRGRSSASQRAVGEAAGRPPWGCPGGRDGHADRRARGQHPGLQALAERLADGREPRQPHCQPSTGMWCEATPATPQRAQPWGQVRPAQILLWPRALSSAPGWKARLLGSPLTQECKRLPIGHFKAKQNHHIKKYAFPSPVFVPISLKPSGSSGNGTSGPRSRLLPAPPPTASEAGCP